MGFRIIHEDRRGFLLVTAVGESSACPLWRETCDREAWSEDHARMLDDALGLNLSVCDVQRIVFAGREPGGLTDFYTARGRVEKHYTRHGALRVATRREHVLCHNIHGVYLGHL